MLEKSQYHEIDNFDQENMQEMLENILHDNLEYKTRSVRLGRRIIKINYYDPTVAYNLQKDNKIIILQDPKKTCHVNFQGRLDPAQISNLWNQLQKKLTNNQTIHDQENIILTREELIYEIIEKIESRQMKIDTFEILKSIEKFQKDYQRFPFKHEIDHLINDYLQPNKEEIKELIKEEKVIEIPEIKNNIPTIANFNDTTGNILIISKPIGRRSCPHCNNVTTYKIHEKVDKRYVLCAFPRLYGKKYYCDGCRGVWREQ